MDALDDDLFENDPTDALLAQPWDDAEVLNGAQLLGVARPGSEPLLLPSSSMLSQDAARQAHGTGGPAYWQQQMGLGGAPGGRFTPIPTRKPSVGSLLDIPDAPSSVNQLPGISPAGLGLSEGSFDTLGRPSPASAGEAWLRNSAETWAQGQQQPQYQQPTPDGNMLRQHYRELHNQQQYHQQFQQQQQLPGMMPVGRQQVGGLVPLGQDRIPITATSQVHGVAKGQQQDLKHGEADAAKAPAQQHQQQSKPKRQPKQAKRKQPETGQCAGTAGASVWLPQGGPGASATPPSSSVQQHQQEGTIAGYTPSGANKQLGSQKSGTPGAAAGLPPLPPDAAAGSTAKKKSKKKDAAGGAGVGGAGAGASSSSTVTASMWKAPPLPKEARIQKEPGVEYEEVLPPGLPSSTTRPLPVPADLFQLPDLGAIMNLDTWNNVLDEQDRAALRALLPEGGKGFDDNPGGQLEQLLAGQENFCFGNPTDKFWKDLQCGAAVPRARRHQEMVNQLQQQLAVMHLREYHNKQVATFLEMQRLWAAQLPITATPAERIVLWKAAQAGEVNMPHSPHAPAVATHHTADATGAPAAAEEGDGIGEPEGKSSGKSNRAAASTACISSGAEGAVDAATPPHAAAAAPAAGKQAAAVATGGAAHGGSSAGGFARPAVGIGKRDVYVYEGPVDFSKNPTKRQAAAAAAAAVAAAAGGGAHLHHGGQLGAGNAAAIQQQWQQQLQQVQCMQQQQQQQQQQQMAAAMQQSQVAIAGQSSTMLLAARGGLAPSQMQMALGQSPLNQLQQLQRLQQLQQLQAAAARQGQQSSQPE